MKIQENVEYRKPLGRRNQRIFKVDTIAHYRLYIQSRRFVGLATCHVSVYTSEEEHRSEFRSGRKRDAYIVADPLLHPSQKRGRPGHVGTAY